MSFIYFSCLSVVLALPSPEYPTPAPTQEYNPDIGQTNVGGYGVNKNPYCHMVEKVVLRTNVNPTPRLPAGPRIRNIVNLYSTTTVRGLLRPWKKPIKSKDVSLARIEFATLPTRST